MDGWITIGTKLDTNKFDQQVSDLESKIQQEEEKQKINIEVNAQLEGEMAEITQEAEQLAREYEKAAATVDELGQKVNSFPKGSASRFMTNLEYEEQAKKVDELNAKIEENNQKQTKLKQKIQKNNAEYQTSINKVATISKKIDGINAKQQQLSLKTQTAQLKQIDKSIGGIQKGIVSTIGKIGKMAIALLGVRSAFMLVKQASSTLAQYNKQYAADLEYMRYVIAQGLAPVLEKIVQLAQTLMAYVNYLVQRLFGVNLFANGSADAFKKAKDNMGGMAKSSKEIKNNLAGFDELNVLSSDKDTSAGGSEVLAPSMDIGGLEDVEIPEWLQKLGDILEGLREKLIPVLESIKKFVTTAIANFNTMWTNLKAGLQTFWNTISPIIDKIKKLFTSLWTQGVKPAVDAIVHIFTTAWQSVQNAWEQYGAPIWDNLMKAIEWVATLMQSLWDNFLQPIWQNIIDALTWLWDKHLQPLWDNILKFSGELTNALLLVWNNFLAPLVQWVIDYVGPNIANVINIIVNLIGTVLGTVADVVGGIMRVLTGIIEFLVGVFTGDWEKAWQGIKDIFGGIWDGIYGIVKGVVNLVIDLINGMIAGIENGLNFIVDQINKLEITNPFTGDEIWSPHVERFVFGRIPKLAKGGIVTTPTRAIVGESGREAVLPLENNTEWMDMLAEKLGGSNNNITIRFTGTASQLVRMLKPELEKEDKRTGKRLIVGGAY